MGFDARVKNAKTSSRPPFLSAFFDEFSENIELFTDTIVEVLFDVGGEYISDEMWNEPNAEYFRDLSPPCGLVYNSLGRRFIVQTLKKV